MSLRVSGTGHRPVKLKGGYKNYPSNLNVLIDIVRMILSAMDVKEVHSGAALGFDQALAVAAIKLSIPLHYQLPFAGFGSLWSEDCKKLHNRILDKASHVNYVHPDEPVNKSEAVALLMDRNKVLVNNCDILLAFWDGSQGGTNNCIQYARKKDKPPAIINLWDIYYARTFVTNEANLN